MRECECGKKFDPSSPAKKRAGGTLEQCPECSTESVVKYAGVTNSEGKVAGLEILRFESARDKERYLAGRSGRRTQPPAVPFTKIAEFRGNVNHKGRSTEENERIIPFKPAPIVVQEDTLIDLARLLAVVGARDPKAIELHRRLLVAAGRFQSGPYQQLRERIDSSGMSRLQGRAQEVRVETFARSRTISLTLSNGMTEATFSGREGSTIASLYGMRASILGFERLMERALALGPALARCLKEERT